MIFSLTGGAGCSDAAAVLKGDPPTSIGMSSKEILDVDSASEESISTSLTARYQGLPEPVLVCRGDFWYRTRGSAMGAYRTTYFKE